MKKLKKVLSLVLVLAMALSVFGVCASAANVEDYADADSITYTEAVGVLSGLGVLEGDENGFRPTSTLTRAEAAKIASYLIGLQDEVVQGPSFSDVAEDNWARGWIAICESQELVHGNGDGTYTPDGTLTGYEWEKIVLCALGYDATIENMVGASWQGGVAVLANKVGLLAGLEDDYKAANEITREQAAQIAYNALFANMVKYPTTIDKIAKVQDETLGQVVFGLSVETTFDVFGAPNATVYNNAYAVALAKADEKVEPVTYATFAIEALDSYDNVAGGTELADIKDDIADAVGKKSVGATVYVDGVQTTGLTTVGGRGVQVSTYAYTNFESPEHETAYRVVVINTYVAEIGTKGNYTASYGAYIVPEVKSSNGTVKTVAEVYGLKRGAYLAAGDLAVGDIVVYNVGNQANVKKVPGDEPVAVNATAKAQTGETATTVSYDGTLYDAFDKDGYVAFDDGDKEYYDVNAEYGSLKTQLNKVEIDKYYGVVYDDYGNIIYITAAKRQTVSDKGHLFVVSAISYTDKEVINDTADLFYPTEVTVGGAQALVIEYTDDSAEAKIVDLAVAQDKAGNYVLVNEYGLIGPDCTKLRLDLDNNLLYALQQSFVEYYVNDAGEYILKSCDDAKYELCTNAATKDIAVSEYADAKREDGKDYTYTTSSNATKLTYITATIDPYTVMNRTTMPEILKTITLSVYTATGYKQFVDFEGNEAYLETKDGVATVGAVIGTENVKSTVSYGMYIGAYEESSVTGEVYSFALSDGTTAKYNVEEPAKDIEGNVIDALAKKQTKQITGNKNQFADLKIGDVVRLVRNSKGNVVAYTKLDADYYGEASKVSYVNGEGWLTTKVQVSGDSAPTTYFGSATYFGGNYIDATGETPTYKAASVTGLVDPKDGNKYVAVYTEDVDSTNKRDGEEIVFVKAVDAYKTVTATVETTYVDASYQYFQAISATGNAAELAKVQLADGQAKTFNQGGGILPVAMSSIKNANNETIATEDLPLYYGETFTVTVVKQAATNGNTAADKYTASAVAANTYYQINGTVKAVAHNDNNTVSITIDPSDKNNDGNFPVIVLNDDKTIKLNDTTDAIVGNQYPNIKGGSTIKVVIKNGTTVKGTITDAGNNTNPVLTVEITDPAE